MLMLGRSLSKGARRPYHIHRIQFSSRPAPAHRGGKTRYECSPVKRRNCRLLETRIIGRQIDPHAPPSGQETDHEVGFGPKRLHSRKRESTPALTSSFLRI